MMGARRLNLKSIEDSLRAVQKDFPRINSIIKSKREHMSDEIVENMLAGYEQINRYLAKDKPLLVRKRRDHVLELNHTVLCGAESKRRKEYKKHIEKTRERFFFADGFNIDVLLDWYLRHRDRSVWRRASGWYTRSVSRPQLFFEGNHRTGALLMSYMLARKGHPPFVLSVDNAKGYFDPSSMIKRTHKNKRTLMFRIPGLDKKFSKFLRAHADGRHLK